MNREWAYPETAGPVSPVGTSTTDIDFDPMSIIAGMQGQHYLTGSNTISAVKEEQEELNEANNIVWQPLKGTSQELAICSPANHVLYCGARGPGKTITQLMRFRRNVGIGYGSYWRGIIFDREFKNLSDLVTQSKRFFPQFEDGATFKSSASSYSWTWPTGEELMFRHVKKIEDYDGFHGWEIPFLGWNELTKYPNGDLYDKFMSINRSSFVPEKHTPSTTRKGEKIYLTANEKPLPPIPLEVFSTTNPAGPGHAWVKERFIIPAKYGQLVRRVVEFYNPITNTTKTIEKTQVAIFGSFYENTYLPDEYKAELILACEREPHLRAAWIDGSWDVTAGGAIDDLWKENVHIIDAFKIPKEWKVDRSFDWGSTHPFVTIWWAESNGEEFQYLDGRKGYFPRGTLIAFAEDYGVVTKKENGITVPDYSQNKGLKLSASAIAKRIKKIDDDLLRKGWIKRPVQSGPADNQIRDVREADVETIETKMKKEGVQWTKSDKSAGSRVVGLELLRERLEASILKERPGIYFTRNCTACLRLLPPLPRDTDKPDDVDTDAIDHPYDAVRYRVLSGSNHFATKINFRVAH